MTVAMQVARTKLRWRKSSRAETSEMCTSTVGMPTALSASSRATLVCVDELALVVRLVERDVHAALLRVGADEGLQVFVGTAAVDPRLADAQHIEVRTVQNENVHFIHSFSMRCAVSSTVPSPSICRSAAAQ